MPLPLYDIEYRKGDQPWRVYVDGIGSLEYARSYMSRESACDDNRDQEFRLVKRTEVREVVSE